MPRRSPVDDLSQSRIDSHYKVLPKTNRKHKKYRLSKRPVTVPESGSVSVTNEPTAQSKTEDAVLTEFDQGRKGRLVGGKSLTGATRSLHIGNQPGAHIKECDYLKVDYDKLLPVLKSFHRLASLRVFQCEFPFSKLCDFLDMWKDLKILDMRYFVDVAPQVSLQTAQEPGIGFIGVEHLSISAGSHLSSRATLRVLRALVKSPRLRSLAVDWISFNKWVDMGLLLRSDAMLLRLELLPPPPWLTAIKCRTKDVNPLDWVRNRCDNKMAQVICLKHCFYSLWMNEPGVRKVWFKGSTEELVLAEACYGTELVFDSIELIEGSARLSCLSMFWFPYQRVYGHLNSLHVSCLDVDDRLETVGKLFPSLSELRLVLIEGRYNLANINSAIRELLRVLPWLVFLELRYPGAPIRSAQDIYMLIEKCDNQGIQTDLRLDRLRLDHENVWDLQADSTWRCSAA
ncbi:hypothetical protein PQX77_017015 [Marasmius sp. AFHP31]|nr:hypothetical protein PQX77_017015 [Marasmius sp. AFHP31]